MKSSHKLGTYLLYTTFLLQVTIHMLNPTGLSLSPWTIIINTYKTDNKIDKSTSSELVTKPFQESEMKLSGLTGILF